MHYFLLYHMPYLVATYFLKKRKQRKQNSFNVKIGLKPQLRKLKEMNSNCYFIFMCKFI